MIVICVNIESVFSLRSQYKALPAFMSSKMILYDLCVISHSLQLDKR